MQGGQNLKQCSFFHQLFSFSNSRFFLKLENANKDEYAWTFDLTTVVTRAKVIFILPIYLPAQELKATVCRVNRTIFLRNITGTCSHRTEEIRPCIKIFVSTWSVPFQKILYYYYYYYYYI